MAPHVPQYSGNPQHCQSVWSICSEAKVSRLRPLKYLNQRQTIKFHFKRKLALESGDRRSAFPMVAGGAPSTLLRIVPHPLRFSKGADFDFVSQVLPRIPKHPNDQTFVPCIWRAAQNILGLDNVNGSMDTFISRISQRAGSMLLVLFAVPLYSQQPTAWKDPTPHITRFVTVDKNVRLEVLDWGGSGRPLALLAGGGDTAHVFDDFAPKLTARFHVYGITRRGYGESGFSPEGFGADRLGDDVLAVLDSPKLRRPVLVGHSIAGEEFSSVASRYPGRVAGLVYLEAGYPYAFDNGKGPTMKEFQDISGPQPPPPSESDLASFAALQQYYLRNLGFTYPEGELRQLFTTTSEGRVGEERDFPGNAMILEGRKKYANIPVPALVIFGIPHSLGKWVDDSTDPKVREAAKAYSAALTALTESQAKALENGVPTARVVRLRGAHHYIYLSNEADVLAEMRSFLSGLR